jgi:hypothetical protein
VLSFEHKDKIKMNFLHSVFSTFAYYTWSQCGAGETALSNENFSAAPSGWTHVNANTTEPIVKAGYWLVETGGDEITTAAFGVSGCSSLSLQFSVATFGSGTNNPATVAFDFDSGTDPANQTTATPTSSSFTNAFSSGPLSIPVPSGASTLTITITNAGASGKGVRIDNFVLCCVPASSSCGITALGSVSIACSANTAGTDAVTISLPYTGMESDATVAITVNAGSVSNTGDNPASVTDGTITFTANEGDSYSITITDGDSECSFTPVTGTVAATQCPEPSTCGENGGLLINEFSNGTTGSQEYIELVVVGDPDNPTAPVNLTGWIIDDNNGDFGTAGIAQGHIILGSAFSAVPPGSIIVIYNNADPNPAIPANDPTDSNSDGVYIVPSNNSSIELTSGGPGGTLGTSCNGGSGGAGSGSTPISASVSGCTAAGEIISTYSGNTYATGQTNAWAAIGYANGADAAQVRCPDATVFHALVYGSGMTDGGINQAVLVNNSSGSGQVYNYGCNSMYVGTAFTASSANGNQTPGAPNSTDNEDLITALENGTINYANLLSDTGNFTCTEVSTPVSLSSFAARAQGSSTLLSWMTSSEQENKGFEVEYSQNGRRFSKLGEVAGHGTTSERHEYAFTHDTPVNGKNYYRLKQVDFDGKYEYSATKIVTFRGARNFLNVVPTAAFDNVRIDLGNALSANAQLRVLDLTGRTLISGTYAKGQTSQQLDVSALPQGHYIVQLSDETSNTFLTQRFVKMRP